MNKLKTYLREKYSDYGLILRHVQGIEFKDVHAVREIFDNHASDIHDILTKLGEKNGLTNWMEYVRLRGKSGLGYELKELMLTLAVRETVRQLCEAMPDDEQHDAMYHEARDE